MALRRHLANASSTRVGDLGEETVGILLQTRGDTIVALGDSGMPRDAGGRTWTPWRSSTVS
jgi:hypothetical protein